MYKKVRDVAYLIGIIVALTLIIPLAVQQSRQAVQGSPEKSASLQVLDVPSGAVMYFDLAACPVGWSQFADGAGRYVVGITEAAAGDSANLGAQVGTSLGNLEDRPVGAHTHVVSDPGHTHVIDDPGHSHAAIVSNPPHSHTISDPGHTHGVQGINWVTLTNADTGWKHIDDLFGRRYIVTTGFTTNSSYTGITVNYTAQNTSVTNQSNTTGVSARSATTGITIQSTGAPGTNAPYVQLLMCRKD